MKTMKLNLLNFGILLLLFSFTIGCEDYLEEDFREGLSPETFYNIEAEAVMAVNGVYANLKAGDYNRTRWRSAPYQFGTDELSASRNIWKELHNYTFDEGIYDGDTVIINKQTDIKNGDIIVALIDKEEATLKKFRQKGDSIALEPANKHYKTQIYGPDRITIQGKMSTLIRKY